MMSQLIGYLTAHPFVIYVAGMSFVVTLALIFALSIFYYFRAKDIAPYLHKIKDLVNKIATLEDDRNQLKDEIGKLNEAKARAETLIAQGKQAEEFLKSKQEEIASTQVNLAAVQGEFEKAKSQLEDQKRKVEEQQKALKEIEEKLLGAEKNFRKKAELDVEIPALQKQKQALEQDIVEQKRLLKELEDKCSAEQERFNKLSADVAKLQAMIDAKKKEFDELNTQVSTKRGEVAELEGRSVVAKKILAERDAARDNEKEKWGSLETPIVDVDNMRDVSEDYIDEAEWLETFNRSLRDNGLIFDPRAIRAFHTGLKCAEQVPLVVLAGISGTGKSLLPELYSAALGANFLSVPVQPRWDSPQDLFGFYNYMEGRYKATELSRLLWQFDTYNNDVASKFAEKVNLPINIVLLDEMNLARVEYYFSDLLSKLETRNGLDYDNEDQRKKAEIELECNATEKPRHMFIAPYTLFVGTMNEDESTQTLSDKVIDRSNVLRFGRPQILTQEDGTRVVPNKSGFLNLYSNSNRVTDIDWDNWKKKVDDESDSPALKFLHDTVTPVIEKLDAVCRSYGFRVDNAMKTYVVNYPGNFKEAVADQIEMKILPKLNGVELQAEGFAEVKDAIITAIRRTEDTKLMAAFEKACPDNGTFFKWRGVMR